MSEVLRARAVLGHASRTGEVHKIRDARRALATAKIAAYIVKATSEAPPLTEAQREHLAAIIRDPEAVAAP